MNTREAVRRLEHLGAEVKLKAGEVIVTYPGVRPVRTSHWSRQKSACRALEKMVREVEAASGQA